ncbi:MAG: preprotein translocase subunit YajC [Clostridiales bacterium]|jgi:preprotein translocase subunit YajC|nr:preprotein translocase subunit YajC [Clostridiales bacterium]
MNNFVSFTETTLPEGYWGNDGADDAGEVEIIGGGAPPPTQETVGYNGEPAEPVASPGFFTPTTLILWGLIIVGMWMLLIRPQRKREKQVREMQAGLRTGDSIITTSGFYGKIVGQSADAFLIEFGENRGLRVWVRKSDIAGIKSPTTSLQKDEAPADTKDDKKDDKK